MRSGLPETFKSKTPQRLDRVAAMDIARRLQWGKISGDLKNRILREVDLDPRRHLSGFEIPAHRIGDHRLQFAERVSLGGDPSALWIIPSRHEASAFLTWLYGEGDFLMHDEG